MPICNASKVIFFSFATERNQRLTSTRKRKMSLSLTLNELFSCLSHIIPSWRGQSVSKEFVSNTRPGTSLTYSRWASFSYKWLKPKSSKPPFLRGQTWTCVVSIIWKLLKGPLFPSKPYLLASQVCGIFFRKNHFLRFFPKTCTDTGRHIFETLVMVSILSRRKKVVDNQKFFLRLFG